MWYFIGIYVVVLVALYVHMNKRIDASLEAARKALKKARGE